MLLEGKDYHEYCGGGYDEAQSRIHHSRNIPPCLITLWMKRAGKKEIPATPCQRSYICFVLQSKPACSDPPERTLAGNASHPGEAQKRIGYKSAADEI